MQVFDQGYFVRRRGYYPVDDTDPFLPRPPPYESYGTMRSYEREGGNSIPSLGRRSLWVALNIVHFAIVNIQLILLQLDATLGIHCTIAANFVTQQLYHLVNLPDNTQVCSKLFPSGSVLWKLTCFQLTQIMKQFHSYLWHLDIQNITGRFIFGIFV